MKKAMFIAILLLLFVFAFAKEWTIMLYLCGDNNLVSAINGDIDEIEAALTDTSEINFLVQVDGMYYSSTERGYNDATANNITECRRYVIGEDGNNISGKIDTGPAVDLNEINMADLSEVADFVDWAVTNYPAENYGIIFWNHGSGWWKEDGNTVRAEIYDPITRTGTGEFVDIASSGKGGIFDDTDGDMISNSDNEQEWRVMMDGIVSIIGKKLRFVGHDMCVMSYMEVIWDEVNAAEMIIASEANIPFYGWPYTEWIENLVANPYATNDQIGTWMVDDYADYYSGTDATLCYMNLEDYTKQDGANQLRDDIWDLAYSLVHNDGGRSASAVQTCINSALSMSSGAFYEDFRDLYTFCTALRGNGSINSTTKSIALDVQNGISDLVDYEWGGGAYSGSYGLGIYLPPTNVYWFPGADDDGADTCCYEWSPWGSGYAFNPQASGCESWTLFIYGLDAATYNSYTALAQASVSYTVGKNDITFSIDGTYDDYEIQRNGERAGIASGTFTDTKLASGTVYEYKITGRKGILYDEVGTYYIKTLVPQPDIQVRNSVVYANDINHLNIYNAAGMLIESADFNNGSGLIDMSGKPSGMYIAKSESYSKKILIMK